MSKTPADLLMDLAIGIGADGAPLSTQEIEAARIDLLRTGVSPGDIEAFRGARLKEVLRDETGRIRGCSSPGCTRVSVWRRAFAKTAKVHRMIAEAAAGLSVMNEIGGNPGIAISVTHAPTDFAGFRIMETRADDLVIATQFGCWEHISDFVSIPPDNGRYAYAVMEAVIPLEKPHTVFGVTHEVFNALRTAEVAQNLGVPEGPRNYCRNCGLPHCPFSGKGLKFGEGDDYWRSFCTHCGAELKVSGEDVDDSDQ
jgi:hypothetical protein